MRVPCARRAGGAGTTVVVPVKLLLLAKSRLDVPREQRQALALAFALDTLAALSASPEVGAVVVVTPDTGVELVLRDRGVHVVRDDGTGLRSAVFAGCRAAARLRLGARLAVVPADLPCLTADAVTRVLTEVTATDGAFVPDRAGTGTTVLLCPARGRLEPRYGPGSAGQHRSLGLPELADAPLRARLDVDTVEDLADALLLGVGPATACVLEMHARRTFTAASCGPVEPVW